MSRRLLWRGPVVLVWGRGTRGGAKPAVGWDSSSRVSAALNMVTSGRREDGGARGDRGTSNASYLSCSILIMYLHALERAINNQSAK